LIVTSLGPCLLHEIGISNAQTIFCHIFYLPKWKAIGNCLRILARQLKSIHNKEKDKKSVNQNRISSFPQCCGYNAHRGGHFKKMSGQLL
jgi:hypothetical protein